MSKEFEMLMIGELSDFLGIQVTQSKTSMCISHPSIGVHRAIGPRGNMGKTVGW